MTITSTITYNLKEDSYAVSGSVKKEQVQEVLEEWLRTQIGLGSDESRPNEKDIYTITIKLELNGDIFSVESDTGNKSLTTGIILALVKEIKAGSDKVTF